MQKSNQSDETIMEAVAKGQIERLSELYLRYRDPLYGFLLKRVNGDGRLAEDLLQDTFERIIKYRSSFRGGQRFRPWLYTIARNALNDRLRQTGRMPIADGFEWQNLALQEMSAQEQWVRKEEGDQCKAALAGLSPNYQEVIDLAWKRGLKYAEIAEVLGISEANVKVRMHRACRQLKTNYLKLAR